MPAPDPMPIFHIEYRLNNAAAPVLIQMTETTFHKVRHVVGEASATKFQLDRTALLFKRLSALSYFHDLHQIFVRAFPQRSDR